MITLFERIGGDEMVDAAVDKFYAIVLADDRIKHFFANTDMNKLRIHQRRFLTYAFGGMPEYLGKNMRDAHNALVNKRGLTDEHFDAFAEDFTTALHELGVAKNLIAEAKTLVETTRKEILNR